MIKISLAECPASHPHAYDYTYEDDYCCPFDPSNAPSTDPLQNDLCKDGNDYKGIQCEAEWPCDSHPSVTSGAAGTDQTAETGKSF